ncbi:hypothetical protein [Streptomyces virginiae]
MPLAPGLAVFNGVVHLAFVDPDSRYVHHWVRDAAAGTWTPVVAKDTVAAYEKAYDAALEKYEQTNDPSDAKAVPTSPLPRRSGQNGRIERRALAQHG